MREVGLRRCKECWKVAENLNLFRSGNMASCKNVQEFCLPRSPLVLPMANFNSLNVKMRENMILFCLRELKLA